MSQEIQSTEVKQRSSRKHFPLIDLTEIKDKENFLESLLQKKYQLNKKVQQFTFGKVYLEGQDEKKIFRIFKDSEMNIAPHFQKKLNKTTVDDDVKTTSSQLMHAHRQNKKDVLYRIYEKEKWPKIKKSNLEDMEESLFDINEEQKQFYTQQYTSLFSKSSFALQSQ